MEQTEPCLEGLNILFKALYLWEAEPDSESRFARLLSWFPFLTFKRTKTKNPTAIYSGTNL